MRAVKTASTGQISGVDQQAGENYRAYGGEPCHLAMTVTRSRVRHRGHEPSCGKQIIDDQSETDSRKYYRRYVYHSGTAAHSARKYHHRSKIGSRTGHQQHETHAWSKSLEHQRQSNGDRSGGTHIHGHSHKYHHEHRQDRMGAETQKQFIGHKHRDKGCYHETYHKPFSHTGHHVNKTVAERCEQFTAKAHAGIFIAIHIGTTFTTAMATARFIFSVTRT